MSWHDVRRVAALGFVLLALFTQAHADELDEVRGELRRHLIDVPSEQVQPSPAPGLYEVRSGMEFGYVTPDGRYLVRGDLIDLEQGVVLTEARRDAFRAQRVSELDADAIAFMPAHDALRHVVHVFIDVDCEYCRDLHREVADLNAAGVGVRYLFYPRRGPRSKGFAHAEQAWCAKDPQQALEALFEGKRAGRTKRGCHAPIAEQLAAALELQVRGTPMIVLPDGSVSYGYLKAQTLVEILDGAGLREQSE